MGALQQRVDASCTATCLDASSRSLATLAEPVAVSGAPPPVSLAWPTTPMVRGRSRTASGPGSSRPSPPPSAGSHMRRGDLLPGSPLAARPPVLVEQVSSPSSRHASPQGSVSIVSQGIVRRMCSAFTCPGTPAATAAIAPTAPRRLASSPVFSAPSLQMLVTASVQSPSAHHRMASVPVPSTPPSPGPLLTLSPPHERVRRDRSFAVPSPPPPPPPQKPPPIVIGSPLGGSVSLRSPLQGSCRVPIGTSSGSMRAPTGVHSCSDGAGASSPKRMASACRSLSTGLSTAASKVY